MWFRNHCEHDCYSPMYIFTFLNLIESSWRANFLQNTKELLTQDIDIVNHL